MAWSEVVLSLGSNLGDRMHYLRCATRDLDALQEVEVIANSPVFESVALLETGFSEKEPKYLNMISIVQTELDPKSLLEKIHQIESSYGRERKERWAARTLDIDIVKFGDLVLRESNLRIPHPEAARRSFVIVPWAAVRPDAVLPGVGAILQLATHMSSELKEHGSV